MSFLALKWFLLATVLLVLGFFFFFFGKPLKNIINQVLCKLPVWIQPVGHCCRPLLAASYMHRRHMMKCVSHSTSAVNQLNRRILISVRIVSCGDCIYLVLMILPNYSSCLCPVLYLFVYLFLSPTCEQQFGGNFKYGMVRFWIIGSFNLLNVDTWLYKYFAHGLNDTAEGTNDCK